MAGPSEAAGGLFGRLRGLAKQVVEGFGGIYRQLAEEHGEVDALLKRMAGSSEDSDVRRDLFPKMRNQLLAHAKGEERTFYPVLQEHEETRALAERAISDHKEIEKMLDELHSSDPATPAWTSRFEQLQKAVESHVELEENEIFPKAKEIIGKDEAQEMQARYDSERKTELHRLEQVH